MLLEILKTPLYTDLILMNLELIFYILFFIQGVSVAVFFGKKWLKSGQIIKFTMGVMAILVLGNYVNFYIRNDRYHIRL